MSHAYEHFACYFYLYFSDILVVKEHIICSLLHCIERAATTDGGQDTVSNAKNSVADAQEATATVSDTSASNDGAPSDKPSAIDSEDKHVMEDDVTMEAGHGDSDAPQADDDIDEYIDKDAADEFEEGGFDVNAVLFSIARNNLIGAKISRMSVWDNLIGANFGLLSEWGNLIGVNVS